MSNFIVILICLVAGAVIRRVSGLARTDGKLISLVVIWFSLPALVLSELPGMLLKMTGLNRELLAPALMPWIVFVVTAILILGIARVRRWNRATTGGLILTAGLGNTSFFGFPLVEAIYGREGLSVALICDQMGTFLVLSTLGLIAASYFAGREVKASAVVRRVVTFPPFIAVMTSIAWFLAGGDGHGVLHDAFARVGSTLVPLPLVSVGWQIDFDVQRLRLRSGDVAIGLFLKLVLLPLLIAVLYRTFLATDGLPYRVSVIEAAMAPMVTAALIATEFDLDGELASLMVGFGIPLSLLTVWLWSLGLAAI